MENQFIYVNSADRSSGDPSDFYTEIRDIDFDVQKPAIGVQNLILPNVQYNINENNNVICFGDTSLTIPEGNYTSHNL